MKTNIALIWLFASATSIIFAIAAFTLAYNNMDDWGWFLFASILCGVSGSTATKKDGE